jgi:hypothetical protein
VAGAAGVTSFEFGGAGASSLVARRGAAGGGGLLAVRGGAATLLAADVHDYRFERSGPHFAFTAGKERSLHVAGLPAAAPSPPLGRGVHEFFFSPRGDAIAFLADVVPGRQGNLWAAPVSGAGGRPGAPVRLAEKVDEPRWAAGGARLGWLQGYDPRSRAGALAVGGLGAPSVVVAKNVSDFDLSPDGSAVAYLVHETAGGYSVDLSLAHPGSGASAKVARGVFGFSFSPDGRWLYYRTACIREAEACDLLRIPAAGLAPGGQPERIAEGVKSYEFAPGRPDRLLVGWSRTDRVALDLAIWEGGKLTAVDTCALPGSAQFLGGDATRLAYAVVDGQRQGVYVAEVR